MKKSVWSDSTNLASFEQLEKNTKTDVLIIGGGLCGLLCAYFFDRSGIDYILVEGDKIASGTTKNTTAKITFQHGLIYDKIIRCYGKEAAQKYLMINKKAADIYEKLCKSINCDYEKKDSYVYSVRDRKIIENEVNAVNSLGFRAKFYDTTELPFKVEGAVCFPDQAQFNAQKFIAEISRNLKIYENTFIRDIAPHTAYCGNAKINAEKIIVATHFPFINKHGNYFLKLYQHRSYVSAFENAQSLNGIYVDEDEKGMSFRNYKNLLLIGGGGHRTGKYGGNWNEINNLTQKYYPKANLKYQWSAQDCMSLDGIPYIGQYSKNTPDLFTASGFNKWGITSSMVSAILLCDMVRGKKNDFSDVFSPQRSILKEQLFINIFETTASLLTPSTKRCPHLGCTLKRNRLEHSWDCPCHGSRFEENGKLIDNPATGDANI